MAIRKEVLFSISLPPSSALHVAEEALTSIGATISAKNSTGISALKGRSFWSFGENLHILIISNEANSSNLKIISELSEVNVSDFGENSRNINKIVQKLEEIIKNGAEYKTMDEENEKASNAEYESMFKAIFGAPSNPTRRQRPIETSSHIFISYRRSDSIDIAGRIYDRLVNKFGREPVFKDVDSIPLGVDFKEYLGMKVSECKVLLAIIGDHWVDAMDSIGKKRLDDPSDFVRIEIESALERGIPVIPLMVRGAQMPVEANLPSSLKKLVYKNGIQIRPDPDFHHDMDRLIAALEKYIQ